MGAGYSPEEIAEFTSTATELGVKLVVAYSADELTNYINKKVTKLEGGLVGTPIADQEKAETVSENRTKDKISEVSIFGHGYIGSLEFAHGQSDALHEQYSFGIDDAKKLNSSAFNNETCVIDIYTCNAATPIKIDANTPGIDLYTSFAGVLATQTQTTVNAFQGKSDYAKMNTNEDTLDKLSRAKHGYNAYGSDKLPEAGKKADGTTSTRHSFIKNTKKK